MLLPSALATQRWPAASSATPDGASSPVLPPTIVTAGAASPRAPAPYTVILLPRPQHELPALATYRLPAASRAMPTGPFIPVWAPVIVRVGAAVPPAPGA